MYCCYADPEALVDPDSVYPIRPECKEDAPPSRFKPMPGKTLSARRWNASFSPDGHLDIAAVLQRIQRGGVHPTIKGAVWEFLLSCYDPNTTFDQRDELRQSRRLEYERLKSKCKEMEPSVGSGVVITMPLIQENGRPVETFRSNNSPEKVPETEQPEDVNGNAEVSVADAKDPTQTEKEEPLIKSEPVDEAVVQWKLSLHQIGLDVVRTDRSLVYYEDPLNRARLWDLLAIYSWIDRDIGYCQGMSDLCSPISILLENEADAFWCFERLMRRLRGNFITTATSIGVRSELMILSNIIKAVDPKLHEHIENLDGGEYLFAFRMLMLMWSMEYNPNLFAIYEASNGSSGNIDGVDAGPTDGNTLKKYGRFEKRYLQAGQGGRVNHPPLSIFLVASVLESRNRYLMKDAKGLDDVVKILNDITGNLDAKQACKEALKIHKKYLNKVKVS
ncbi:TBC1 domain family member 15 isoform X2 [Carex littledalei]|uniref:TBC1 domain family member 15 isoform X2 n=1 Tax=Carex littledalei TaxID=544730 RepID=A0A833RI01_9POAL|nr:TBC1 domain family member 15 isoform X2 [Carex littledalei]